MEADAILRDLTDFDGLPREALRAATDRRAEMTPVFLKEIENYLAAPDTDQPSPLFHIFFLLGEWREKSAYRPLARLLRRPGRELDVELGDAITMVTHRVMAGVFDGDLRPLFDIILDPKADEFVRVRMFDALVILVRRGEADRDAIVRFLRDGLMSLRPQAECYVWDGWASAIARLGLVDCRPLVRKAFDYGFIGKHMMNYDEFEQDLAYGIAHPGEPRPSEKNDFELLEDTAEELSRWGSAPGREEGERPPLSQWERDDIFRRATQGESRVDSLEGVVVDLGRARDGRAPDDRRPDPRSSAPGDIEEILRALMRDDGLPREALKAASDRRVEMIPAFLEEIEDYLAAPDPDVPSPLFFIFLLLGEWRERSAYRPLARLLRRPFRELVIVLGDAVGEMSHRVMAGVFDGDPRPLFDIVLDPDADEFVRSRMCEALAMVALRGDLDRDRVARFLRDGFASLRPRDECFVWYGWQSAISMLGLVEHDPLVRKAFDYGFFGNMLTYEDFRENLAHGIAHPGKPLLAVEKEYDPLEDVVEELSGWAGYMERPDENREGRRAKEKGAIRGGLIGPDTVPKGIMRMMGDRRPEMVPVFIRRIEEYIAAPVTDGPESLVHIFFLLGEWREKSAYRPLARLMRLPTENIDAVLGEVVVMSSHRVMAGVFDGDLRPLFDIILDPAADEFARARMFDALVMVVNRGEADRDAVVRFLGDCFESLRPRRECYVWDGWANAIGVLGLADMAPLVKKAMERGFIGKRMLSDAEFERILEHGIAHPGKPSPYAPDDDYDLIEDAVEELDHCGFFEERADREWEEVDREQSREEERLWLAERGGPRVNPFKGVGRNDPCPCGSGRKFKKCCGR